MGCCFSSESDQSSQFPNSPTNVEEEAVKEVLPETATPPPPPVTSCRQIDSPFIKVAPLLDFSTAFHPNGAFAYPAYGEAVVPDIGNSFGEVAVTEKRRNNNAGELRRRSPARPRNRSFSGDCEVKREKPAGRSPGRRSDSSPNRVNGYRDRNEGSGRRSRSPVTGQGRKTGRSPGRVGSGLGDRTRRVEEERWAPTGNELLENPLVSLECFIFL